MVASVHEQADNVAEILRRVSLGAFARNKGRLVFVILKFGFSEGGGERSDTGIRNEVKQ